MRIAFFWTWEFSKNILEDIFENKSVEISLVVSQPNKLIWKDMILINTPVKEFAINNKIEVLQPSKLKLNTDFFDYLKSLNLDFIVVVAYWKIIPSEILSIPKYGCINIHGSILPKYRWASPIQECLKNWDKSTWLTIMYMSEWMDEWEILSLKEINIDNVDMAEDIFLKFEQFWANLLIETLNLIIDWKIIWVAQDESKASYCKKINKEYWEIKFKEMDWDEIFNLYRAYHSWPGIYTYFNWKKLNLEDISLWEITNEKSWILIKNDKKQYWIISKNWQVIILNKIKLAGKKTLDINSFINWNKQILNYIFN